MEHCQFSVFPQLYQKKPYKTYWQIALVNCLTVSQQQGEVRCNFSDLRKIHKIVVELNVLLTRNITINLVFWFLLYLGTLSRLWHSHSRYKLLQLGVKDFLISKAEKFSIIIFLKKQYFLIGLEVSVSIL